MKIRFYIDKESGLSHIYRHEVREKMRSRMYSKSPVRIAQARKTLELLSDKHRAVDFFELFMSPILEKFETYIRL